MGRKFCEIEVFYFRGLNKRKYFINIPLPLLLLSGTRKSNKNLFFPLSNWFPIKEFDFEEFRVPEKKVAVTIFAWSAVLGKARLSTLRDT